MGPLEIGLLIAAVVVVGIVLVRSMTGRGSVETIAMPQPGPAAETETAEVVDEDPLEDADVTVTLEGVAFVPRTHGVLLYPLIQSEERPDWLDKALDSSSIPYNILNKIYFSGAGGGAERNPLGTPLGDGDLTGARVVRGSADEGWRLETLGRDGDFGFHPFATREGAETALHLLLDHGVVQRPMDEEGSAIPASPEDFEEARRRYDETQAELALEGDEEPPREGPWVSDRR